MIKTVRVDHREQPDLYEFLKKALDSGSSAYGWQVTECDEAEFDSEVCVFQLEDCAIC